MNSLDPPLSLIEPPRKKIKHSNRIQPNSMCILSHEDRIFEHENTKYQIILPPRTGCRSLLYFLIKKEIIKLPAPFSFSTEDVFDTGGTTFTKKTLNFNFSHDRLNPNSEETIIVTVRNPIDRLVSFLNWHLRKSTVEATNKQLVSFTMSFIEIGSITNFWLSGKTPNVVLKLESQQEDLLTLPFINDLTDYEIMNDVAVSEEIVDTSLHSMRKQKIKEIVMNEFYDTLYNRYREDFENFGYK